MGENDGIILEENWYTIVLNPLDKGS